MSRLRRSVAAGTAIAGVLSAAALAAQGDPQKHLTPKDQAHVRAIVLKAADLPGTGWKSQPNPSGPNPRCKNYSFDLSDLTETGDTNGFTLSRGVTSVGSSAGIFVSLAQARAAYARFVRPGLAHCLAEFTARSVPGVSVRVASAGALSFPHFGDESTAVRFSLDLAGGGRTVRVFEDAIVLRVGRAVATIGFTQGLRPFSASLERSLTAKVAARMR